MSTSKMYPNEMSRSKISTKKMNKTRIPLEIVDNILLLLPVTVAIHLGRDYPKRKLLSEKTSDNVKNFAHAQWMHQFGVSGNWPRKAFSLFCNEGSVSNLTWLEDRYGSQITVEDRSYALDSSVLHGTRAITHHLCDQNVSRIHAIRLATRIGEIINAFASGGSVADPEFLALG